MTQDECARLLATAMLAYPNWLRDIGETRMAAMVATWHRMLQDIDYQLADAALAKHVATSQYPPSIAELRSAALSLLPSEFPDAEEAWGEVVHHLQRTGYTRTPEWSHPIIGRCVQAMWGSWANACASIMTETVNVDRAQFLRMYQTMTKREREAALLPAPIRELVGMLAERFRPPGSDVKSLPTPGMVHTEEADSA